MRKSPIIPLIIVNIVFFLLQKAIPGFTETLLLVSDDVLLRPWILVTSMFLHGSFMHLLFNMYALYIFGPLVEKKIGSKRFLYLYFAGGIIAALAFSVFNPHSMALGASGAIMAVLGMVIIMFPDLQVLFFFVIPMSMRTAGILFAAVDLLGFVSSVNTGIAHIAHLAGLAIGLTYAYYLLKKHKKHSKGYKVDLSQPQEKIDAYFRVKE